jgi:hypothetical protein
LICRRLLEQQRVDTPRGALRSPIGPASGGR